MSFKLLLNGPARGSAALQESPAPARLFNWNFVLLWQGQAISQIGNQAFALTMMFWTREATGSSTLVGLLMMLSSLPGLVLGPFGGTIADRHSRKALIVGSDLLRGVALLGLGGLMLRSSGSVQVVLPALIIVALLEGAMSSLFFPAISATIPDLVPRERLASANSLFQLSSRASITLGQAMGGVLYGALGAAMLCLADALSFLLSALCTAFVFISRQRPVNGDGRRLSTYLRDTMDGLRFVRGVPGMPAFLLMVATLNFFFMPVFVLLPFFATNVLNTGSGIYGFLMAAFAAGGLLGFLAAASLKLTGRARQWVVTGALAGASLAFGALGFIHQRSAAMVALLIVGFLTSIVNVLVITLCQLAAPGEIRGRVMGLVLAMSRAVSPIGMGLGGIVGDLTGHDMPHIYMACGLLPLAILFVVAMRPDFRTFLCNEGRA